MTATKIKGSCLCGAVRYEFLGTPTKFFHCHCSRCRKASGTGHASNIFFEADGVEWTGSADARQSYKVPDADRFSTHFCKTCGSPVPRDIPKAKMVLVPAGSLDSEVDFRPQARIFQDSRTAWSCDDTKIKTFPNYPE